MGVPGGLAVGQITEQGQRLCEAKRQNEARKAAQLGVSMEKLDAVPPKNPGDA